MIVAVPSKGRAGATSTNKILPQSVFFVPEYEASAYRMAGIKQVVGVPESVRGITPTRNWILENSGHERVVFIDDDSTKQGYVHLLAESAKHVKLSADEWMRQFERCFDVCEEMGLSLWGLNTEGSTRSFYPYKPFIFRTYVTGSCMGVLASKNRFNEAYPVKEDYELCLRCIKRDGGVLGVRYLYWQTEHWTKDGGCKDYRTQAMEDEAIQRLMREYPGMIRKVSKGGSGYSIALDF